MRFNTLLGCSPWVSQQGSIHNSPGPQSGPNGIVKHQHRSRRKTAECTGQTTGVKDPLAGNSKAGEHVNRSALASPFASCRMLFTGYSGCPPTAPPGAAALLQGSWASAARADRPEFTVLAVQWHPRRRGKARVLPGGASARSGRACHAGRPGKPRPAESGPRFPIPAESGIGDSLFPDSGRVGNRESTIPPISRKNREIGGIGNPIS